MEQHQREQAHGFRVGQQLGQEPPQADGLARQVGPRDRLARGGGVALVEHEVDHREHGFEPLWQFLRVGDLERDPGVADLRLAPDDPLRHGRGSGQEGGSDLIGREAAHLAEGERDLDFRIDGRVAAGEDEPQPVVLDLLARSGRVRLGDLREPPGDLPMLAVEGAAAAQGVDRLEPPRGYEPGPRVIRDAFPPPPLDRCGEGFMQRLLRQVKVPHQPHQRCEDPTRLRPVELLDECVEARRGVGQRVRFVPAVPASLRRAHLDPPLGSPVHLDILDPKG